MTEPERVGDRYRSAHLRACDLLSPLDEQQWNTAVPACPGWRVRDVVAHLVGIIEDALAGRLTGPPPPEQTREQVDRHRDDAPADLLDTWISLSPTFESALTSLGRWPAFLDVLSHEHDIRAALGDGAFRDHDDVKRAAALLSENLPDGLHVSLDGRNEAPPDGTVATLSTTSFEYLRLRLGRRSTDQTFALDWDGDPRPFQSNLFIFGPRATDLLEPSVTGAPLRPVEGKNP